MSFESLKLPKQYIQAVEDLGFQKPTIIQQKAIPVIRSGQHLIGIAQTGTGKTAAYQLPIFQMLKSAEGELVRCLIIVPTKELVLQVSQQAKELAKYTDLRIVPVYGGVGRKAQADALRAGVDIVVSTPLRILELYEHENINLKKTAILVFDEADRLMDMGFLPQLNLILDVLPRKKQILLFSATFSKEVEEISWNFMDFPTKIEVSPESTPVETVSQFLYNVPNRQTKLNLLIELLRNNELNRVIVFAKTKDNANFIFEGLKNIYFKDAIRLIHSNKGQNTRIHSFNEFKSGEVRILISTDVMARGIDVSMVSHVINFDVPTHYEDYVHRIGRTGRAENKGLAFTFVNKADVFHIGKIQNKIRMEIPYLDLPGNLEIAVTGFEENQWMEKQIDDQKKGENPEFKGAFHEKKDYKLKVKIKASKKIPNFSGKAKSFNLKEFSTKNKTSKHHRKK